MRRDYVTTFVTEALVIAGYLLAFRFVAVNLGAAGFGEYALARRTLSLLLPLGAVGLDIGITRYVSYAVAERSSRSAGYVPAGLVLMAVAVAVLSAVLLIFNRFWAQIFFGSEAYAATINGIPLLLAGGSLHVAAYGYLRGLARIQRANLLMIVNHAVVPVVSIVVFGSSVSAILIAMGLGWTLVSLVPLIRLPMTTVNLPDRIKELARFGIPRVPGDVVQLLLFALPGILVAHASDIRVAGIVAFGVAAVSMIGSGLTPVSFVLLPMASRLFASGSLGKLRTEIVEVVGITLAGTLLLVVILEVFAAPVVRVYLGPGFSGGVDTLRLTLVGALPWGVFVTLRSVIDARHVRPINARNMVISFACFVVLALLLPRFVDPTTSAVLAFVLALYLLASLTVLEVGRIAGITGRTLDRRPVALARIAMLAGLPVAVLVSSPQRIALSAAIAAAYVALAVFSFKLSRANRLMLGYVGAIAAWMILSWLRTKFLLHLDPDQLSYGTSKLTYFVFIVLPFSAAIAMMVDRAEDIWPAGAGQLVVGLLVGLITVALLGDRFLGADRYSWQGNLIALGTVVAIQPWLIRNFLAAIALGVLGVGGIVFAGGRQSLVAFVLVLLLSAVYWATARFIREHGGLANRLRKAVTARYVALPLALVVLTGLALVVTYNPKAYCDCVTDRIISLQENGAGDRDTLLIEGGRLFIQSPVLGTGLGSFAGRVPDSLHPGVFYQYPHNVPLEIAAETGLVGFLVMIVPLLATWWILLRNGIQRASPAIAGVLMIVAVFFIVANISGDIPSERGMWIFGIVALKLGIDAWQTRASVGRSAAPGRVDAPVPVS
jgi:O-antigen/teichoic acid export membrane protein